jgi:hypothetical protein
MGNSQSSQDITNTTLNSVAMSVMTKNSTNISASSNQSNTFNFSGNTGTNVNGFNQSNSSTINIQSLSSLAASGTLQADLSAALKNAVDQAIPALSINSDQSQKVNNAITNSVNTNITTENLNNLAAQVRQNNTANISGNSGGTLSGITQDNSADLVLGLVGQTTSTIMAAVKASGAIDNTATQKSSSIFGDIGSMYMIFIVIIIIIVCGGGYYLTTMGWQDLMKPVPLAVMGTMFASVFAGIYLTMTSSPSK